MTRIILVRHCEAAGNLNRRFQGHTNAEVTENGKKQLELLALRMRNVKIDYLYSSPLKRAYATAEAINQFHHLPIYVEADLMEINGGYWEGGPWNEFSTLYPEDYDLWENQPWKFAPRDGEPMVHVFERMKSCVDRIAGEHPGKTVCIATHGCAIRNFLCYAGGKPIEELNSVEWCDNTAVSVVEYDDSFVPHIVSQNDASHLNPEVSTFEKQDWWRPEKKKGSA